MLSRYDSTLSGEVKALILKSGICWKGKSAPSSVRIVGVTITFSVGLFTSNAFNSL